jgi:hypothetical protein
VVAQSVDHVPLRYGRDGRGHRETGIAHRGVVPGIGSGLRLTARSAKSVFQPSALSDRWKGVTRKEFTGKNWIDRSAR